MIGEAEFGIFDICSKLKSIEMVLVWKYSRFFRGRVFLFLNECTQSSFSYTIDPIFVSTCTYFFLLLFLIVHLAEKKSKS